MRYSAAKGSQLREGCLLRVSEGRGEVREIAIKNKNKKNKIDDLNVWGSSICWHLFQTPTLTSFCAASQCVCVSVCVCSGSPGAWQEEKCIKIGRITHCASWEHLHSHWVCIWVRRFKYTCRSPQHTETWTIEMVVASVDLVPISIAQFELLIVKLMCSSGKH